MDIHRQYDMEIDHIEESGWSDEEKQEERILLDDRMREHEENRQAEHDEVERRYGR